MACRQHRQESSNGARTPRASNPDAPRNTHPLTRRPWTATPTSTRGEPGQQLLNGDAEASLQSVAVLFTDAVGSTELSHRVPPEVADDLRREHFRTLREAIAAHEGTEVKTTGDGLMVVFATASAALSCAVAMQQGVEHESMTSAHPIGLRIGLSQGETSREGRDYFGDPVVEASRLCDRCSSGQILVAAVVPMMAGRRNSHECPSIGDIRLKGVSEPVAVVEVHWAAVGRGEA